MWPCTWPTTRDTHWPVVTPGGFRRTLPRLPDLKLIRSNFFCVNNARLDRIGKSDTLPDMVIRHKSVWTQLKSTPGVQESTFCYTNTHFRRPVFKCWPTQLYVWTICTFLMQNFQFIFTWNMYSFFNPLLFYSITSYVSRPQIWAVWGQGQLASTFKDY